MGPRGGGREDRGLRRSEPVDPAAPPFRFRLITASEWWSVVDIKRVLAVMLPPWKVFAVLDERMKGFGITQLAELLLTASHIPIKIEKT